MAAMKGNELVQYVTERIVHYMETPTEIRKHTKKEAKAKKEHWLTHWFGWGPVGLMMWLRGKKRE